MDIDWKEESRRFDGVADSYDTFRPDYPTELIETVISMTGIQPGGRILEIGCGTGKATTLFAGRGYSMLCLDPGKNLISVAGRNFKDYSNVELEVTTFESWNENQNSFDLVLSAQAFHWVSKEIGYPKAARVLKEKGYLVLFWNMYPDPKGEIFSDLDRVYRERAPDLASKTTPYEELIKQREGEIVASGCFGKVEIRRFPWSARYDTAQYIGLLNTYSDHLRLSEKSRKSLYKGIAEVIDRHGGVIEKPYVAVQYVAQKRLISN